MNDNITLCPKLHKLLFTELSLYNVNYKKNEYIRVNVIGDEFYLIFKSINGEVLSNKIINIEYTEYKWIINCKCDIQFIITLGYPIKTYQVDKNIYNFYIDESCICDFLLNLSKILIKSLDIYVDNYKNHKFMWGYSKEKEVIFLLCDFEIFHISAIDFFNDHLLYKKINSNGDLYFIKKVEFETHTKSSSFSIILSLNGYEIYDIEMDKFKHLYITLNNNFNVIFNQWCKIEMEDSCHDNNVLFFL